jgi:hypothetical protein
MTSCAMVQQPVGSWLSTNGLPPTLRPALEEHGAEKAEDLAYLEPDEIDELGALLGDDAALQSKLTQALRTVRIAAGVEAAAAAAAPAPAAAASFPRRPQPVACARSTWPPLKRPAQS